MARDPARAVQLKNDGNVRFQARDYVGAESLYSKAYVAPSLPVSESRACPGPRAC